MVVKRITGYVGMFVPVLSLACGPAPAETEVAATAQDVMPDMTAQESAAAEMASFIADLEVMREKFRAR